MERGKNAQFYPIIVNFFIVSPKAVSRGVDLIDIIKNLKISPLGCVDMERILSHRYSSLV